MTSLTFIPFDIETTGFAITDEVTVAGFALPLGCRVFARHAGGVVDGDTAAERVSERLPGETHLVVSVHETEAELLAAVGEFAAERLRDRERLLVAYNGETYRGGFDLPFLRTRLARLDLAWPFAELPYADLLPVIRDRFNTTRDGEAHTDLDSAYAALCDGQLDEFDPFAESGAAVTAFDEGRLADVVQHNVVDVKQTAALGRLAQRYCSKSDISLKSLTPTSQEFQEPTSQ